MKKIIHIIFITLLYVVLMTGCGGGGSTYKEDVAPAQDAKNIGTGYFIDSPVSGIFYRSGKISGVTDVNGTFKYDATPDVAYNTDISFSVGNIKLGTLQVTDINETDHKLYPNELLGFDRKDTNNTQTIMMLRLLQSLDDDGDTSHGIHILSTLQNKLEISPINFENNVTEANLHKTMSDVKMKLVNEFVARNHFEKGLNDTFGWNVDTIGPLVPVVLTTNNLTNEDTFALALSGEANSTIYIDNVDSGIVLDSSGIANLSLNTSGSDGNKTFLIYLKDTKDNLGEHLTYLVKKDSTPPQITVPSSIDMFEKISKVPLTISATDVSPLTYSLSGTDASSFTLGSDRVLNFKTAPSYATKLSYSINIDIFDGINSVSVPLTIKILQTDYDFSGDTTWEQDSVAMKSGKISGNQITCIEKKVTGNISFDWKVSSEYYADYLKFYIDGSNYNSISGEQDWSSQSYYLVGNHTAKWCYTKDGASSSGEDAGWIRNVVDENTTTHIPYFTNSNYAHVNENQKNAITLTATDADNNPLTYSISGVDASYFDLNSSSRVVTFKVAPDYEDENRTSHRYQFTATVSDGIYSKAQYIFIYINNTGEDTIPNSFSFTSQSNVALSSAIESNSITISGIDASALISISNGEYSLNSGAWTNADGSVSNGTIVKVRHTSSGTSESNVTTTLTIGGVNGMFTSSTLKEVGLYIRSAVYDNNRTVTPNDDELYIYFSKEINPSSISSDMSQNYDINGTGAIGSASIGEYNSTIFYRHKVSLNSNGTSSVALDNNGSTKIVLHQSVIRDINGSYPLDYNQTIVDTLTPVLKTGQTTSYATNDDGTYKKGVARSYTRDAGKAVVTDNVTGLQWQDDNTTTPSTLTWDYAITYCTNLEFGGFSDWRLPSKEELETIVDYGKYSPSIDQTFTNVTSSYYWSSTTDASYTSYAWLVSFNYGYTRNDVKTDSYYVRCVRDGQ